MSAVKNSICVLIYVALFSVINSEKLAQQKIQSYQSCHTDRDCKINSFCYGNDDNATGKCKCLDGFELIRNTTYYECLAGVKLGDACEKDIQCQVTASPLSRCNQYKICECNSESQAYEGTCFMKVKLGDVCMSDANCYLSDDSYAFCSEGRCSCRVDERPSGDRMLCISSRTLGQPCKADIDCASIDNTKCVDTCRCAAEYTVSRNESACVIAATKFGDPCDFDGQCSQFLTESICNQSKCTCFKDYHEYGNRCVPTKKIGERCEEDAQCLPDPKLKENVKCQGGTCRCLFGQKGDGSCNIEKINNNNFAVNTRTSAKIFFIYTFFVLLFIL